MFWNWNEAGKLLSILGRLFLMAGVLILPHLPKILCKFSSRSWTKNHDECHTKNINQNIRHKKSENFYSFTYFSTSWCGLCGWFDFPSPATPSLNPLTFWEPKPLPRRFDVVHFLGDSAASHFYCAVKPLFGLFITAGMWILSNEKNLYYSCLGYIGDYITQLYGAL